MGVVLAWAAIVPSVGHVGGVVCYGGWCEWCANVGGMLILLFLLKYYP